MIAARSTWGAISLSNSTFAGNRRLHDSKAAGVAARPREVLDEAAPNRVTPHVERAAIIFNPKTSPYRDVYLSPFNLAAASNGMEALAVPVGDETELETVIAAQARGMNGGLVVMPDGFLNVHRAEIVSLTARYRLPAAYPWRFFAELGGLLSYGSEQSDEFRLAASYVDRILKGEKPAELAVQAPTDYKLVINLKTAKLLGLDVPPFLQQRADKLIE